MFRVHPLGLGLLLGVTLFCVGACSDGRNNGPGDYCRADNWCHAELICVARTCRQLPGVAPGVDASRARDSGVADSGPGDSGPGDSGVADSGPSDSGPSDSGPSDSGPSDSGPGDSGAPDSGPMDAASAG